MLALNPPYCADLLLPSVPWPEARAAPREGVLRLKVEGKNRLWPCRVSQKSESEGRNFPELCAADHRIRLERALAPDEPIKVLASRFSKCRHLSISTEEGLRLGFSSENPLVEAVPASCCFPRVVAAARGCCRSQVQ